MLRNKFVISLLAIFGMLASCSNSHIRLFDIKNVSIHTELQEKYLSGNYESAVRYATGREELSRPEPITLSWKVKEQKNEIFSISISENSDLSLAKTYKTSATSIDIYNLKIATKYYWNVSYSLDENTYTSKISSFVTEKQGPRNLYVDGITNVRDVGGWEIDSKHRVKQGLVYRSGRLNTSNAKEVIKEVTEIGQKVLLDDLCLKTEMDLRTTDDNEVGSISSSVLGKEINYLSVPMNWKDNVLMANLDVISHIFSDIFTDESNYPLIFHCNIGTDRTGLIAYLLNGLLGVSQENLYIDYLFSNFGFINGARTVSTINNSYANYINSLEGETLSSRISNLLNSIGVTNSEIDKIKEIFIEEN